MTQLYTPEGIVTIAMPQQTSSPRRATLAILRQMARLYTPKGLMLN